MRLRALLFLAGCSVLAACTDEEIVYVERPPFNEPADPAAGFLGYYTSSTKQTTCGNCHADFQGSWKETGHAGAYATLKAVNAAASCYSCHTVNERGNDATGIAGHDKVQDSTYYDVQCESCHGAGFEHASLPDGVAGPLASIGIPPDLATAKNGCGECHQGEHHPFVEQWADADALQAHSAAPAVATLFGTVGEHLDGAPDIKMLQPVPAGDPAKGTLRSA